MIKRLKLIFLLAGLCLFLPLAGTNTDSLSRAVKTMRADTGKINALYELAVSKNIDSTVAIGYVNEMFALASQLNYEKGTARAWQARGIVSYHALAFQYAVGFFEKASSIYTKCDYLYGNMLCSYWAARCYRRIANYAQYGKALAQMESYARTLHNEEHLSYAYEGYGNLYRYLGRYPLSIENYNKAIKIAEKNNRLHDASVALNNLSLVYEMLGQDKEELVIQKRNYKIIQELKDSVNLTLCLSNLSALYQGMNKTDSSLYFINMAMDIINRKGEDKLNFKDVASVYGQYAALAALKGDYKVAIEFQNKSINLSRNNKDVKTVANGYGNLAEIFLKMNNRALAEEYFTKALEIYKGIGFIDGQLNNYRSLEELYRSQKNEKKAEECALHYKLLKDSLAILSNAQKLAEAQALVEIQAQQEELLLQERYRAEEAKKVSERARRIYAIVGSGLIVLISLIVFILYRRKKKA